MPEHHLLCLVGTLLKLLHVAPIRIRLHSKVWTHILQLREESHTTESSRISTLKENTSKMLCSLGGAGLNGQAIQLDSN
jgi:hypothetical protein